MSADSKAERIKELERVNTYYKKRIIKLENEAKLIVELQSMVKQQVDRSKKRVLKIATLTRRTKEVEEAYGQLKKQNVAENKLLLRRYKEQARQYRALERKMDSEFVKKKKPRPSLRGRIMAIKHKILDFID